MGFIDITPEAATEPLPTNVSTAQPMNFFQHQDKAQKNAHLVLLFLVAVAAVVISTAAVISGVEPFSARSNTIILGIPPANNFHAFFTQPTFIWSALITLSIIILGSAFKAMQLGGNACVAAMDGKHLHPDTTDPHINNYSISSRKWPLPRAIQYQKYF